MGRLGCPFIYALKLILTSIQQIFKCHYNQMTIPRPSFEIRYKLFPAELYFLLRIVAEKKQVGVIKQLVGVK